MLLRRADKINFFYGFILIFLFLILVSLSYLNVTVRKQISQINILPTPLNYSIKPYPSVNYSIYPFITASAALVLDNSSKVPLFERNSNLRFPPASTTKIMTALVALDYFKPTDAITVKHPNVEGAVLGLASGEKFTFEDSLYAMLLPSSNEAALAIAQNYPGGESAFIAKMNEKAAILHLQNTHFADPIGIDDESDYSTPHDLAILSGEALKNKEFAKIVSTRYKLIKSLDGNSYNLYSLNEMLGIPGVNGVKTGHTQGAGDVLVTSRKIAGGELIFVVMQSQDRFADTRNLLYSLDNNINYSTIRP